MCFRLMAHDPILNAIGRTVTSVTMFNSGVKVNHHSSIQAISSDIPMLIFTFLSYMLCLVSLMQVFICIAFLPKCLLLLLLFE